MKNVKDDIVVESPKSYGQQPLAVYVPRATFDSPGIVRPSDKHFIFEDGVLKINPDYVGNGGNGGVVDSALSETSKNPVQNLVITREINQRFAKEALKEQIGDATTNTSGLMSASDKRSLRDLSLRENLINIIGAATTELSGLMSAADKANLEVLIELLGKESGDADNFVNTIREILKIFNNYSESVNLAAELADKVEMWQVTSRIKEFIDDEMSSTSTNAVQNKVVKSYIESYVAASGGGSGGGSSTGKSLQTVCNTRLGWFSSMEDRASIFTATMGYDLSQNENCVVIVDGISKTVPLVNGVGTFGTVAVPTDGTGITATISVDGRYVKMTNMMYEHGESVPEDTDFGSSTSVCCDIVVKALTDGDFNVCTDYKLLRDGEACTFVLDKPLTEGCTIQLNLNGMYENITYPQSMDYDLYYAYNGWLIRDDGANTIYVGTEYGWAESSLTLSIDVSYGSSSNSGGSGSSGAGPSKLSKVIKVYPYSYCDVVPADSSKSYYIGVKAYYMGELEDRSALVWHNGQLEQTGSSGMLEFYSDGMHIRCSYGSSDGADFVLVIVQEIDSYDITCFIEGTKVLLRDPVTHEIYSKNIEDVKHFDYCAYWMPNLGRLTASRVIAPPITGECTEYDKLYFSDGSTVNVFGTQFFWHADEDRLVDWKKLTPEDRVCTFEGNLVNFVKSEHVISDKPVKHYTLMVFMGKYLANGIQVGDKRELFYPRMLDPVRKKYWDKLNDVDQKHLIRVHQQGMKRRNWKFTEEYRNTVKPIEQKIADAERVIKDMKEYLYNTDYLVTKLAEGLITEEEFAGVRAQRQQARDSINEHELILMELMAECEQKKKEVRDLILGTHVPKFAGKFVGKSKAII